MKNNIDDKLRNEIIKNTVNEYKKGNIKNSNDVEDLLDNLIGPVLQALLNAELDQHLDYQKHEKKNNNSKKNARNGFCKEKTIKTKYGQTKIATPRDRKGTFDPVIVPKKSNLFSGLEEACVSLYSKGMSTRDIEEVINNLYSVKITKDQVSHYVSKIKDLVITWQNRPLKKCYAFTYADCLYYSIKDEFKSTKKAIYIIVGITLEGYKEILGFWIDKSESATFWTTILEDIKKRGVEDILYMSSDGVAGFKNSLNTTFPKAKAQRCIFHLSMNLSSITPNKILKSVREGFKEIYSAPTEEIAESKLLEFKNIHKNYPKIVAKVEEYMIHIYPLFELPKEIRKIVYTTNIIESVNSSLRRVTHNKGAFPSESSLFNLLYLRIIDLENKWQKPIPNNKTILNQLIIMYGDRISKYLVIEKN